MGRRVGRFEWERKLRDAEIPWHVKALLLLVGTYMDADGSGAKPHVATLSRQTGLSRQRVFELLADARRAEWQDVQTVPGKASERRATVPNPSDVSDGSQPVDNPTRQTPRTPPSDPSDGTRQTDRTHTRTGPEQDHRRARARDVVRSATDATDDETRELLDSIARANPGIRNLTAYVASLATGDLDARLAQLRADRRRGAVRAEIDELRQKPPCVHGYDGGDQPHPDTGQPLCPLCRAAEQEGPAA